MSRHAPVDLGQLAKDTAQRMTKIAKQAYAPTNPEPVRIVECWMCYRGRREDGSACFNCAGLGRIATDPEFEI